MESTKLVGKDFSSLVIRKIQHPYSGWPLYVALISDASMDTLDKEILDFIELWEKEQGKTDTIQKGRNFVGELSNRLQSVFRELKSIEGVAIIYYLDKCMISSLWGDFMTHTSCRIELYTLLGMTCHV